MSKLEELIKKYCSDGVEYVKLVKVAHIQYGCSFDSNLFTEDSKYIPLIRIRDIMPAKAFTYYKGEYTNEFLVKKGDILVGMDGNFNLEKWKDRDGLLNQRVCKIYTKDSNEVINGYLYYLLKPLFKKIENEIKGGTVKHLSAAKINQIIIPLPNITIQKEIVRILDSYTEKYTELQSSLNAELQFRKDEYEYYANKLLDNTKGMVRMCLGDLYDFKNGLNKGKEFFGKGSVIVNFTDVYKNKFLKGDILKGRVEVTSKELKLYSVQRGDVFFTRTSETQEDIGVASVMLDDINECVFSGFVLRARPKTDLLLNRYIAYYLSSYNVRKDIVKYSTFTTRALTSGSKLSRITISIPSLSDQQRIVDILDRYTEAYTELVEKIELEIKVRQEEYEYYRDQLLTFKRKAV